MGGRTIAPRRPKKGGFRRKQEEPYRINHRIKAPMVRVVGENVNVGIYPIDQARKMADEQELDLVEISPKANPPVCKIIDYRKFLYEKKKKEKEIKQKTAKVQVKEIRMGPNTDEHDFNFKLNHAKKFLSEGNKVKAEVFFKGRTIIYKDQGKYKLLKFADELEELGKVESMPKMEGKRMIMMISPKKTK